ncbi:Ribonuclease H domain [Sesbania bispinosa]|nr:Ribonuclease H domain [Sesbania bispinosa]
MTFPICLNLKYTPFNVSGIVSLVHSSVIAGRPTWIHSINQLPTYQQSLVGWSFPNPGWVKANVDGFNLGSSSVLLAELRGIETALRIACEHEYKQLWLESDSLTAVRLNDKGITHDHPYAHILKQISSGRQRPWRVVISHTFREGNMIVDCLANMSHSRSLGLHMLSDPLESVVAFCGKIL